MCINAYDSLRSAQRLSWSSHAGVSSRAMQHPILLLRSPFSQHAYAEDTLHEAKSINSIRAACLEA